MIFIHIVSFARLLLHMQPLCDFLLCLTYFKPVGNRKGEHQVIALHNVSGSVLSHLPASVDMLPCALRHIF